MLNLNKKNIVTGLTILMGLGSLSISNISMAHGHHGGGHHGGGHHHRPAPQPYRHHHHWGRRFAGGVMIGALFGAAIANASDHQTVYYNNDYYNCRQVVNVYRQCEYNQWGEQRCYRVRKIRHVC